MAKKHKVYIVHHLDSTVGDNRFKDPETIVVIARSKHEAVNSAATHLTIGKKKTRVNVWVASEKVPLLVYEKNKTSHCG